LQAENSKLSRSPHPADETNGFPRRCPPRIRLGQGKKWLEDIVTTHGHRPAWARTRLPSVDVDSFNVELKGRWTAFSATRASKGRVSARFLDTLRKPLKEKRRRSLRQQNPPRPSARNALDEALVGDDIHAFRAGALARSSNSRQELAYVTRRFLKTKGLGPIPNVSWSAGGFSAEPGSAKLAIARTDIILKAEGFQGRPDPDFAFIPTKPA